jgi:hypothetical protein
MVSIFSISFLFILLRSELVESCCDAAQTKGYHGTRHYGQQDFSYLVRVAHESHAVKGVGAAVVGFGSVLWWDYGSARPEASNLFLISSE